MKLEELLRKNELFSLLHPAELKKLADMAVPRHLKKGDWLVYAGDEWAYLFIVAKGNIVALKESRAGRVLILLNFGPGEIFWGFSFFRGGTPMPVSLKSVEDTTVYLWPRKQLLPFLQSNGEMSWQLSCLMVERMQFASDLVEGLAFHPVTGRLAKLLLERFGENTGEALVRDFTLDDVAAQIGSTREMVCRILYKFADVGALQINRTELRIKDRSFLVHAAGFNGDEFPAKPRLS